MSIERLMAAAVHAVQLKSPVGFPVARLRQAKYAGYASDMLPA